MFCKASRIVPDTSGLLVNVKPFSIFHCPKKPPVYEDKQKGPITMQRERYFIVRIKCYKNRKLRVLRNEVIVIKRKATPGEGKSMNQSLSIYTAHGIYSMKLQ